MIAEVIVDVAVSEVDRIFDYDCPFEVSRGMRVLVPFGRTQTEGFVMGLKDSTLLPADKIKSVISVLDKTPVITEEMFDLLAFMTGKLHLLNVDVLRLFIPSAMRGGRVKELTRQYARLNEEYRYKDPAEYTRPNALAQFELLEYLHVNKGIALSRDSILNNVWRYDYDGDARTVDTHIKKLRSKLGDAGEAIKTVRGIGYKFEGDV